MVATTPKTQAIGYELRRAREAAGLSARQLADKLGKAHTTITRWEAGERAPRPVDVATVMSAIGASSKLREAVVELARDDDERRWTAETRMEERFHSSTLHELERQASHITLVSPLLVPGILQTADYARAIMITGEVPADEAELRVTMRVGRRDVLLREKPAQLLAITSELVLNQSLGGPEVMAEQLRALLSYAELPNVTLQVLPLSTGWHPALEMPFSIREFKSRTPVVNIESQYGSQFIHEIDTVNAYRDDALKVAEAALSPADSVELIAEVLDRREKAA